MPDYGLLLLLANGISPLAQVVEVCALVQVQTLLATCGMGDYVRIIFPLEFISLCHPSYESNSHSCKNSETSSVVHQFL